MGMSGSGKTVTEAKQDAGRRITALLEEIGAPILLTHRGQMIVMSRDKYGWGYRLYQVAELKIRTDASHCSCGFAGKDDCLVAAVRHLADLTRTEGETDSALFDALRTQQAARERYSFALKAAQDDVWLDRRRTALARGMSENDAHDYAGRNPMRPELWLSEVA
jgi:hypothetical protein